jgi:hypothetical protein
MYCFLCFLFLFCKNYSMKHFCFCEASFNFMKNLFLFLIAQLKVLAIVFQWSLPFSFLCHHKIMILSSSTLVLLLDHFILFCYDNASFSFMLHFIHTISFIQFFEHTIKESKFFFHFFPPQICFSMLHNNELASKKLMYNHKCGFQG